MFEHMKNYDKLLRKVSTWLKPSQHTGKGDDPNPSLLFVHIFCHKTMPYDFVEDDGWMAQTFFSGNNMSLRSCLSIRGLLSLTRDPHFIANSYHRWNNALA